MQHSLYQNNRQSLLMMAGAIFVSVTAAVIVSTVIIMSLMRGEIASALTSNIQNSSPTAQTASSCAVPQDEQHTDAVSAPEAASTSTQSYGYSQGATPLTSSVHFAKYMPATVSNSYNNTNISTNTTTNNVSNTEIKNVKITAIKDSFNDNSKNSHNPVVIKDNEVNVDSNNKTAINSGNEIIHEHVTNTTNNVTSHSNNTSNTTNSNNTLENHLLSDNETIVITPLVAPVPEPTV